MLVAIDSLGYDEGVDPQCGGQKGRALPLIHVLATVGMRMIVPTNPRSAACLLGLGGVLAGGIESPLHAAVTGAYSREIVCEVRPSACPWSERMPPFSDGHSQSTLVTRAHRGASPPKRTADIL